MTSDMRRGLVVWTVVAALVAGPVAAGQAAAKADGAESPEALVTALGQVEEPWQVVPYIAPDERAQMSVAMLVAAQMMVAMSQFGMGMAQEMGESFEEGMSEQDKAAKEAELATARAELAAMETGLEEIMQRHELGALFADEGPGDEAALEAAMAGVDHAALLRDLFGFLEEIGDGEEGGGPVDKAKKIGELRDLEVSGDTASGTVDGEPTRFRRVDGRWYLSMAEQEAPAEEEAAE